MKSKNKGLKITIIILTILLIGAIGYIVYDYIDDQKLLLEEEQVEIIQPAENENITSEEEFTEVVYESFDKCVYSDKSCTIKFTSNYGGKKHDIEVKNVIEKSDGYYSKLNISIDGVKKEVFDGGIINMEGASLTEEHYIFGAHMIDLEEGFALVLPKNENTLTGEYILYFDSNGNKIDTVHSQIGYNIIFNPKEDSEGVTKTVNDRLYIGDKGSVRFWTQNESTCKIEFIEVSLKNGSISKNLIDTSDELKAGGMSLDNC